jgi:hypothetical protein
MRPNVPAVLFLGSVACASAARAAEPKLCDRAVSTDVVLRQTGDADAPYEARILLRDAATDAVVPLQYRLSPGHPIQTDVGPGGEHAVFPAMKVSLALDEDASEVRYAIELKDADRVCQTHRGLVPVAGVVRAAPQPRLLPIDPR